MSSHSIKHILLSISCLFFCFSPFPYALAEDQLSTSPLSSSSSLDTSSLPLSSSSSLDTSSLPLSSSSSSDTSSLPPSSSPSPTPPSLPLAGSTFQNTSPLPLQSSSSPTTPTLPLITCVSTSEKNERCKTEGVCTLYIGENDVHYKGCGVNRKGLKSKGRRCSLEKVIVSEDIVTLIECHCTSDDCNKEEYFKDEIQKARSEFDRSNPMYLEIVQYIMLLVPLIAGVFFLCTLFRHLRILRAKTAMQMLRLHHIKEKIEATIQIVFTRARQTKQHLEELKDYMEQPVQNAFGSDSEDDVASGLTAMSSKGVSKETGKKLGAKSKMRSKTGKKTQVADHDME